MDWVPGAEAISSKERRVRTSYRLVSGCVLLDMHTSGRDVLMKMSELTAANGVIRGIGQALLAVAQARIAPECPQ